MIFIGIDPGLTGGMAALLRDETCVYQRTPTEWVQHATGRRRHYRIAAMREWLAKLGDDCFATIEQQHVHHGNGLVSAGTIMYGYGVWIGLAAGMSIPYQTIMPRTWKASFGGLLSADKKASITLAHELFPALNGKLSMTDDGIAEALLLAYYGKERMHG